MLPNWYFRAQKVAYRLLTPQVGAPAGIVVDWFIMLLVATNVVTVMLETVDVLAAEFGPFFWRFEVISVVVFTVEYVGRIWSAVEERAYQRILTGRLNFASRFPLVIDLLAILPCYLMLLGLGIDLRFLRPVRLFRFLRLLKLARYSESMRAFGRVFREKTADLLLALFANLLLLILAASTMYHIEHPPNRRRSCRSPRRSSGGSSR